MSHCCLQAPNRRLFINFSLGLATCSAIVRAEALPVSLPREVAGIQIPGSHFARAATGFSMRYCPPWLFNHCMRTFLFGALYLQRKKLDCRADLAFAAAALHDLGLLPAFESHSLSFEIDGANAVEKFARDAGASAGDADIAWHAVELHDGKWALTERQGPEAMLVSIGAGTDVNGPDPEITDEKQLAEILRAFPRLNFKREFTSLLIGHCRRKPLSQRGTWLEGLCREHRPDAWSDTVENDISRSGFKE